MVKTFGINAIRRHHGMVVNEDVPDVEDTKIETVFTKRLAF